MRTARGNLCRNILAAVWFAGLLLPAVILAARTYVGTYYDGKEQEAWAWFTSNSLPTFALIIAWLVGTVSAIKADAPAKRVDDKPLPLFFFVVTATFSVIYLIIFNLIFFLEPMFNSPPLDVFKRSGLFLSFFQGILTATMARFFINVNVKS